jgi:DNA-binding NtrC family response regulator
MAVLQPKLPHDTLDRPAEPAGPQTPAVQQQTQLQQTLHALTNRLGRAPLKVLVSEAVGLVERHCIESALAATSGNRSAAAKLLGLSRQSLYMKLARYGIGDD